MRNTLFLGALFATAAMAAQAEEKPTVPATWQTAQQTIPADADSGYASPVGSEGSGAIPDLPLQAMKQGNVTFITGGAGDEEKAQIMSTKNDYNLHLLMTAPGGAFVSNVHVRILSGAAVVLDIPEAGPYLYASLPAGSYAIEATTQGGESKQAKTKVPAKGAARALLTFSGSSGLVTPHTPTATVD